MCCQNDTICYESDVILQKSTSLILKVSHPGIWSCDIKYQGDCPWDLPAFPTMIFFTPCPEIIRVYEISFCHVCNLHCPYIPTPISSCNFWKSAMRFVKPPLIFALSLMINTYSVPQLSWRKIRSISGFIVIANYAVTSRRLQEYDFLLSFQSTESDIPD